jgi:hypothetical protein
MTTAKNSKRPQGDRTPPELTARRRAQSNFAMSPAGHPMALAMTLRWKG